MQLRLAPRVRAVRTAMRNQHGDTIIEVLLAVTVFSILAVGTMVIMNRGAAIAERSLEITLVRQHIDAQAEMLRYVHGRYSAGETQYVGLWSGLVANRAVQSTDSLGTSSCPRTQPQRSFALRPNGSNRIVPVIQFSVADSYAKLDGEVARGIWVQLLTADGGRAYDAYIQACWDGAGGQTQTTGTIVRLYDPKV